MKIVRTGVTRIVFLTKNYAIKAPNFTYSWQHFLKGLVANIEENRTWKWCPDEARKLLCPVLFCSWGGWILIMPRADTERHAKDVVCDGRLFNYSKWKNIGLGGDDNYTNYAYLNDKLVKIDYN